MKPIESSITHWQADGKMNYIFGPVASRRLGLSLGVDLVPPKYCSYDCIYCQIGRTTVRTIEVKPYLPAKDILKELRQKLNDVNPDVITLSGSGEPTLHSEIEFIIEGIKNTSSHKVAVLTNGSLLWDEAVRRRLSQADLIMPTLSTAVEATFNAIHRPHPELELSKILAGLRSLREEFRGHIGLEIMLISGVNDTADELRALRLLVDELEPDQVQLNTVVRPPADPSARPLDRKKLEEIEEFFGGRAGVIPHNKPESWGPRRSSLTDSVLEAVKRRPLRAVDVATVLNAPLEEVERLMRGLVRRGELKEKAYADSIYYTAQ